MPFCKCWGVIANTIFFMKNFWMKNIGYVYLMKLCMNMKKFWRCVHRQWLRIYS